MMWLCAWKLLSSAKALFVQLEISTGISPTRHHLLTSQSRPKTVFPGFGIAPCSQREPAKAIDLFFHLRLVSDSLTRFDNKKKNSQSVALEMFQLEALLRLDGRRLLPNRRPDRGQTAPFPLTDSEEEMSI